MKNLASCVSFFGNACLYFSFSLDFWRSSRHSTLLLANITVFVSASVGSCVEKHVHKDCGLLTRCDVRLLTACLLLGAKCGAGKKNKRLWPCAMSVSLFLCARLPCVLFGGKTPCNKNLHINELSVRLSFVAFHNVLIRKLIMIWGRVRTAANIGGFLST